MENEVMIIKVDYNSQSAELFFDRYCIDKYNKHGKPFESLIYLRPNLLKEGTIIEFHIEETGNVTFRTVKTIIRYKVLIYDSMQDVLELIRDGS